MSAFRSRPASRLAPRHVYARKAAAFAAVMAIAALAIGCGRQDQGVYVVNGGPEAVVTLGPSTLEQDYRVATSNHMFPSERRYNDFKFWRLDMTNKYNCETGEHMTIKTILIGKSGETRPLPLKVQSWKRGADGSVTAAITRIVCDPRSGERVRVRSTPDEVYKTYLRKSGQE